MTTWFWFVAVALVFVTWCYAKSQTWADKGRFTLVILSALVAVGNFYLITRYWVIDGLSNKEVGFEASQIIPWFFVQYLEIFSIAITLCAWWKKGFAKLNSGSGTGVIRLMTGLSFGVIGGGIYGLIGGIVGVIDGLMIGLSVGVIGEGIGGVIGEFTTVTPSDTIRPEGEVVDKST